MKIDLNYDQLVKIFKQNYMNLSCHDPNIVTYPVTINTLLEELENNNRLDDFNDLNRLYSIIKGSLQSKIDLEDDLFKIDKKYQYIMDIFLVVYSFTHYCGKLATPTLTINEYKEKILSLKNNTKHKILLNTFLDLEYSSFINYGIVNQNYSDLEITKTKIFGDMHYERINYNLNFILDAINIHYFYDIDLTIKHNLKQLLSKYNIKINNKDNDENDENYNDFNSLSSRGNRNIGLYGGYYSKADPSINSSPYCTKADLNIRIKTIFMHDSDIDYSISLSILAYIIDEKIIYALFDKDNNPKEDLKDSRITNHIKSILSNDKTNRNIKLLLEISDYLESIYNNNVNNCGSEKVKIYNHIKDISDIIRSEVLNVSI